MKRITMFIRILSIITILCVPIISSACGSFTPKQTPENSSLADADPVEAAYSDASSFYHEHLSECYRFTGSADDLAGIGFARWEYPGKLGRHDPDSPLIITFDGTFDHISIIDIYQDDAGREWAYLSIYLKSEGSNLEANCWICLDDSTGSFLGG